MSTIAAGTTLTTALVETGDTTGNLVIQTNGTTTAATFDTSQNLAVVGAVKSNTYQDASGGNTATINSMTPTADSLQGFRNRIINGDMRIDQRKAGASVTPSSGSSYTLDRWKNYNSQASKLSFQQNAGSVTPPVGFTNYLGATSLSAYSVGSSDEFDLYQLIEGYNIADLGWGTANAKTVTLSFWVRSSLTGTFGGSVQNSGGSRTYPFSYTISAANTWEQKSVTISGDTSGTWLTTNGVGISLLFSLGAGSSVVGTAGSWTGTSAVGVTGQTQVVGTNGATWYITGAQLEVGSVATPFERRDYGRELALCQRYYYRLGPSISNSMFGVGWNITTTQAVPLITFPVTMRTAPSALEQSGTAGDYAVFHGAGSGTTCNAVPTFGVANIQNCRLLLTVASGLTANGGSMARAENSNGYLGFSAEL